MTLADIAKDKFGDGTDNFTDEIHEAIKEAAQNCDPKSLEIMIGFLDGDIEWQGSVLWALASKCARSLSPDQLKRIEQLLRSDNASLRLNAASVLGWNGTWPNDALLKSLVDEKKDTVQRTMLATVLGLAGVPDRQSVKLAMQTVAAGTPITRELVDQLIAQHKASS